MNRTFAMIKPDGTSRNLIGKITAQLEDNNLKIAAMKMKTLPKEEAEGFYAEHKERPFFQELVNFMCSKPVVLLVLEGENAVKKNREIMGATNPAEAAEGSIRKLYSQSIGENTIHGSDSNEAAQREIKYFFSETEIS